MRIYLIRHAKAERESPTGLDEDRALTKRGRGQAEWLGRAVRDREGARVRLLASPAVRAQETGGLLAEALGCGLATEPSLGLDSGPQRVVEFVSSLESTECCALVGHNPTLSRVVDVLVGGAASPPQCELRTGEAAVLEIRDASRPLGSARVIEMLRIPESEDRR